MTLETMTMVTMREKAFVGFCMLSICLICELCAQQNGNVTSVVDAAMTSQRDFANDNETATPVDGDVIFGHNGTGSVYIQPGQVPVENDERVTDEAVRHHSVPSNDTQIQAQIRDADSRTNNDSANGVLPFRNSSEEIANSDQKLSESEEIIEQDNYYSNQTEEHRGTTFKALLNTSTFSAQGHSSSTTLPPGKQESVSVPSFETFTEQHSSRTEIDRKSATEVTGVTDKRVIEDKQARSAEHRSPVSAVPAGTSTSTSTGTSTSTSTGTSRRSAKYATAKLVRSVDRTGPGHVTRSEADDSRTRDVTGSGVVTKAATAEFIYKNLWEEVDVRYEAAEGEGEDDGEANGGSIGAGKERDERTGTSTENWKRRAGGGGGGGDDGGGGRPSTLDARGQLLVVEMEKARREEDAEHLRAARRSFQWQDEMGVLVPVLCGMFGAMSLVLAGYFLRNCPRNIRLLLFKTKDSNLKRRKSDLSLLIDNSSGDERP